MCTTRDMVSGDQQSTAKCLLVGITPPAPSLLWYVGCYRFERRRTPLRHHHPRSSVKAFLAGGKTSYRNPHLVAGYHCSFLGMVTTHNRLGVSPLMLLLIAFPNSTPSLLVPFYLLTPKKRSPCVWQCERICKFIQNKFCLYGPNETLSSFV